MATKVKIKMDNAGKILLKRGLNKDGQAQEFFTKQCAKWMSNYVPYEHGRLSRTNVTIEKDKVIYDSEYAKKQYYTNKGKGVQGTAFGGLRGKYWDRRMWNDRGNEIVKSVAEFCRFRSGK